MAAVRRNVLPRTDQLRLAALASQGDRRAADQLIRCSLGFITQRVRRLAGPALREDSALEADLVAEGNRGMFEALLRYDASRNLHPLTYCAHWIDLRIRNALALASGPASVGSPQHWRASGRPRTQPVELSADFTDSTPSEEPSALELLLGDEAHRLHRESLRDALASLDPTDRRIIELRYLGKNGDRPSLTEVGQRVQLSRERTRQREIAALMQLLSALSVPADRLSAVRQLMRGS